MLFQSTPCATMKKFTIKFNGITGKMKALGKVKMTLAKLCWNNWPFVFQFHQWHDCVIFIFIPTRSPKMQNWVKPLTSLLPVIKQWRILRVFMTYWQWHWFGGHSMACWQRFVICLIDTEAWVVNLLTGTSSLV